MDIKRIQLGMPLGTAANRLKKGVLFKYVKMAGDNFCYQCGAEIDSEKDFSVEHKIPYLFSNNPSELFFNLNNIAFSHLHCNVAAARKSRKHKMIHPSLAAYRLRKCRCAECVNIYREHKRKYYYSSKKAALA